MLLAASKPVVLHRVKSNKKPAIVCRSPSHYYIDDEENTYLRDMATYGRIDEFDPDSGDWQQYMERMEFYFAAN